MSTTLRRASLALLTLILSALAMLATGLANPASASAYTGNLAITGGLDHPYLPDAPATVAADPTTGCPLGYFYGDLNDTPVTDFTGITCQAFQSDYDQNAVVTYSTNATTCPAGYQREQAGDGYSTPHFIRCWPFATEGDPADATYSGVTTTAVGCAPGYSMAAGDAYPGDTAATCIIWARADAPAPDGCTVTFGPDGKLLPCVVDANGNTVIDLPKMAASVSIAGSTTVENTVAVTLSLEAWTACLFGGDGGVVMN